MEQDVIDNSAQDDPFEWKINIRIYIYVCMCVDLCVVMHLFSCS